MKKHLLFVDDVEYTLQMEREILKKVEKELDIEMHVECASTVAEAAALIDKYDFDVIICDMNLPDGTGTEIAKKAEAKGIGTSVVALTIYPHLYEQDRAYFDAFLKKPILPSHFKEDLKVLLSLER